MLDDKGPSEPLHGPLPYYTALLAWELLLFEPQGDMPKGDVPKTMLAERYGLELASPRELAGLQRWFRRRNLLSW
jgi:hypothetical protein